jgi:hypothetical protein
MRLSLFCGIALALMAGCCYHESASKSDSSANSAEAECKSDDCCTTVSRSSLLSKKVEAKGNDESK